MSPSIWAFGVVVGARGLMASRRKRREKNPLRQRSVVGAASSKRAKQLGPLGCNAGHSPEQIPSSPFCFRRSAAAAAAGDLGAGGKERTENPPGPPLTDGVPSSPAAHVRARTDGIVWINSSPRGSRGACAIFKLGYPLNFQFSVAHSASEHTVMSLWAVLLEARV